MIRKILPLLFFISIDCFSQQYIANDGEITFFSYAPIEDIKAVNKKVSAAFDVSNNDIVFQLYISDFNFRKKLMQTHFNENYLESDVFPKANFIGKVFALEEDSAIVRGLLTIHGISKEIEANGMFIQNNNTIKISSEFKIKLEDYNVSIPTIVMYKIAEEILVNVVIKLNSKR
jgi:polyisoprenoid-binding protein YceI|tara:strand:- start:95 stop:616 length:522 start_codon:yes stop_codon:yes gene_type:complete